MLLCEGVHEVDLYYDYDTLENMTLVVVFRDEDDYFAQKKLEMLN